MQTDVIFAHQLENNDFIDYGVYVYSKDDAGDNIVVDFCDEDGEHTVKTYAPFDMVCIVTSFDDEEKFEDVPIED